MGGVAAQFIFGLPAVAPAAAGDSAFSRAAWFAMIAARLSSDFPNVPRSLRKRILQDPLNPNRGAAFITRGPRKKVTLGFDIRLASPQGATVLLLTGPWGSLFFAILLRLWSWE